MFDEVGILYRGLALGLMIAAPVGPIGLLCIRRSIQKGLLIGFFTGLGAATADTIFGAIAAFSVTVIVQFLTNHNSSIRIVGGAFLLFVAWHTWRDRPKQPKASAPVTGALAAFISGLVITLTNPVTMFAILAVVAAFGDLHGSADAATIVGGIFLGSSLWWLMLSGGVSLVRGHFTETRIMLINRITAVALSILAVWAFASGIGGLIGHALPLK